MKERLIAAFQEYENALVEYANSAAYHTSNSYNRVRIYREVLVETLIEAMGEPEQ